MDFGPLLVKAIPFIIPVCLVASFLYNHKIIGNGNGGNGKSEKPKSQTQAQADSGKKEEKKLNDKDMTT